NCARPGGKLSKEKRTSADGKPYQNLSLSAAFSSVGTKMSQTEGQVRESMLPRQRTIVEGVSAAILREEKPLCNRGPPVGMNGSWSSSDEGQAVNPQQAIGFPIPPVVSAAAQHRAPGTSLSGLRCARPTPGRASRMLAACVNSAAIN